MASDLVKAPVAAVTQADATSTRAAVLRELAEHARDAGAPRRAAGLATAAIALATRSGERVEEGLARVCRAQALEAMGRDDEARPDLRTAIEHLTGRGQPLAEALARAWLGSDLVDSRPAEAVAEAVRARSLLDRLPERDAAWARAAARVVRLVARLGAPEEAGDLASRALDACDVRVDAGTRGALVCARATALADAGDRVACEGRLDEAAALRADGLALLTAAGRPGAPDVASGMDIAEGRMAAAAGRPILALARFAQAGDRAADAGLYELAAQARVQAAGVLIAVGAWDDARAALDLAEEITPLDSRDARISALKLRIRLLAAEDRAVDALPALRAALQLARGSRDRELSAAWAEGRARVAREDAERREAALARLSRLDPLTGLPNRRAWDRRLPTLVSAADSSRPLTVAIVDVDHFKQVNDTASHLVGDEVLRRIGRLIAGRLRQGDLVARIGGDEFGIAILGSEADASAVLERLRAAVADADWGDLPLQGPVSVSVGAAGWRPGTTADELATRADGALFAAKRAGRDRVSRAEPASASTRDRIGMRVTGE